MPGQLPTALAVTAVASAVTIIAVAAGTVGVNRWVAAGNTADTTSAASAAPSDPAQPVPVSQSALASWPVPAGSAASARRAAPPVSPGSTWPGLGPDWARPNPRRVLLSAILSEIWPGILRALLPDPYRSGWYPA
ncbi:MAG TPA: hypothetical protein VMU95_19250 [Trebonia sp.]|nr:hypothetical protein [Trebonia sp.]